MQFEDLQGKPYRRLIAQERFAHQGDDMGLSYKAKGAGPKKRISAGTHIGVCDMVVDLGLQETPIYGTKRQVYIRFEIPEERWEYEKDGKQMEGPGVIGETLTASMHKKARLRARLEGWRGRQFSDKEAEEFDITSILGKAAMISVIDNENDGTVYSNIAGISALPKGMPAPKAELPLLLYHDGDQSMLERLPEWIQKKIEEQVPEEDDDEKAIDRRDDTSFNPEITDEDIPW